MVVSEIKLSKSEVYCPALFFPSFSAGFRLYLGNLMQVQILEQVLYHIWSFDASTGFMSYLSNLMQDRF